MASLSVVQFTTGAPGAGKSYVRCAHFVPEFLLEHEGDFWSNFPWCPEKIAEYCSKKSGKSVDHFLDRMKTIPEDELQKWMKGISGPWDYFKGVDIDGAHIALDEIHNFCPRNCTDQKDRRAAWQTWLGEIRHCGATVECITQAPTKVNKVIEEHALVRYQLMNCESRRDPFFKILLGDWYELKAKFMGEYVSRVAEIEERQILGKWAVSHTRFFSITPDPWFTFYDSFSSPHQGGGKKAKKQLREYEKRKYPGLLWWFYKRNAWKVSKTVLIFGLVMFLTIGGGGRYAINGIMDSMHFIAAKQGIGIKKPPVKKADIKIVNQSEPEIESADYDSVTDGKPESEELANKLWGYKNVKTVTKEKDGKKRELTQEEILKKKLESKDIEISKMKSELEDIKQKIAESFAVSLISPDCVTFRNGYSYRKHEIIDWGQYKGKKIEKIDCNKRIVCLDDGTVLRMGL